MAARAIALIFRRNKCAAIKIPHCVHQKAHLARHERRARGDELNPSHNLRMWNPCVCAALPARQFPLTG